MLGFGAQVLGFWGSGFGILGFRFWGLGCNFGLGFTYGIPSPHSPLPREPNLGFRVKGLGEYILNHIRDLNDGVLGSLDNR